MGEKPTRLNIVSGKVGTAYVVNRHSPPCELCSRGNQQDNK